MSAEILTALKAEEILKDSTILGQTLNLKITLAYKTDKDVFSFEGYFHILNAEIQSIERIELSASIPPGGAQSYLAELSMALQLVTDKIESAHTKAIYFEGKLKSAAHLRDNLQATFSAWYLIALSEKLKFYDIKLPISTQKALAESEFARLVGEDDLNIDGLIAAVEVMIVHLKDMKKIANEKYKLGSDQANATIVNLPFNGVSEGNQFSLLKQRWGMEISTKNESEYDDTPISEEGKKLDALIQKEEDDPIYIQRQERAPTTIPEGIHKIISGPALTLDNEVTSEDLLVRKKKWREEVEETSEKAYEKAEEMYQEATEEWVNASPLLTEVSNSPIYIKDSFAGIVKIENGKGELIPLKKRIISFDDEDDNLEIISERKPAKNVVIEEGSSKPKKKVVAFDDEDIDFGTPLPEVKAQGSSKKISFDDDKTPF